MATIEFVWTIPGCWTAPGAGTHDGKVHMEMEISTSDDFSGTLLVDTTSLADQAGWTYSDGSEWVAWPANGVLAYIQRLDPLQVGGIPLGTGNSNTDPDYRADVKQGYAGYNVKFATTTALGDPGEIIYYRWRQYDVGAASWDSEWHLGQLALPQGSTGATTIETEGESTLTLTYSNLLTEVSKWLGYGDDTSALSTGETSDCDAIIQAGYRQFLVPPVLPPGNTSHVWSFLSPKSTFDTVVDEGDYNLPERFAHLAERQMTISSSSIYEPIGIRSESEIRDKRRLTTATGTPTIAAIRPRAHPGTTGQRWEILLYPTPDAAYTIEYRYNVLATALSSGNPYPLGGMEHSETILASCLSVAERRKNDTRGVMWEDFMSYLAASVSRDSNMLPKELGYNSDPSMGVRHFKRSCGTYPEYEGTIYGEYAP